MGAEADHSLSVRDVWAAHLSQIGFQGDKYPLLQERGLKGWQVDSLAFKQLQHIVSTMIPLRPVDHVLPWGDGANASKQLHAWEQEFGGPVVYLLVPDSAQPGDNPWLAAPVLRKWLTHEEPVQFLGLKYYSAAEDARHDGYRAAIIARTGKQPEEFWPTKRAAFGIRGAGEGSS
jgi:hypothetical protein